MKIRNHVDMNRWADMAKRNIEPHFGVKGRCVLGKHLDVLSKFLPPEYTHHFSLLVTSVHLFLSDEISSEILIMQTKCYRHPFKLPETSIP